MGLGEDNILWGTDSVWYGPTQQLIDSFRAFQIPLDMQEEFGYPALTARGEGQDPLAKRGGALYGLRRGRAPAQRSERRPGMAQGGRGDDRTKGNPT